MTLTTTEGIAALIARLRKEESRCDSIYIVDAAIETIERLVKERDEARKQICESHSRNCHQAYQHAIECNWDCYKETP